MIKKLNPKHVQNLDQPRVLVGVPVFNAELTISRTLTSLKNQTYQNIHVFISDDCSMDSTSTICENFVKENNNFSIVIQPVNLGLYRNLEYLSKNKNYDYFMWLASDDFISPDFISNNVDFLEKNPEFVASSSKEFFIYEDSTEEGMHLDLVGTRRQRIKQFLKNPKWSHNVFYSLIRTNIISELTSIGKSYTSADWSFDLELLCRGKINTVCDGAIYFGTKGVSRQSNADIGFANNFLEKIFPLFRFTLFSLKISLKYIDILPLVTQSLIGLNIKMTKARIKRLLRSGTFSLSK